MESIFAGKMSARMAKLGMDSRKLSKLLGCGPTLIENVRIGRSIPSGPVAKVVCTSLGIDYQKAIVDLAIDKMERRFGDVFWVRVREISDSRVRK
jgi:ribosome-binding protein aMBF1 (putative translation factor)